jgi:hypothetical protein
MAHVGHNATALKGLFLLIMIIFIRELFSNNVWRIGGVFESEIL